MKMVLCRNKEFRRVAALCAVAVLLSACASVEKKDQPPQASVTVTDPYEKYNRKVYNFNQKVDKYVAEPISDAYKWITPGFVQTGVSNFFSNLSDIRVFLNSALQGKFKQSAQDTGRFVVNSTLGVAGLFDVATDMGLEKHDEDFDQTLAVWGVPQGPYLVLPLVGPSTSRGVPGGVVDLATNPTSYIGAPAQLASILNTRANADGALKFIDEASLDPYIFTREAYLQNRKFLISDGKDSESADDILQFEEEFYLDEEESGLDAETNSELAPTQPASEPDDASAEGTSNATDTKLYEQHWRSYHEAGRAYQKASRELQELKTHDH